MSNAVFPTFAGLKWGVSRTPMHKTAVRETVSGREFTTSFMISPRYLYKLSYEVLRETVGFTELQQLLGFFNARQGSADSFLFTDPNDNAVVDQVFGVGDGASKDFQLARTLGGNVEPVYDTNGAPVIKIGVTTKTPGTDYTINATGGVTFAVAPANGFSIKWTGSFYWRVRFTKDLLELSEFMQDLWEAKSVEFITRKP
jgi:uncharacterized protein (TIGR02217 family)